MKKPEYDICVIGGGSGGLVVAAGARDERMKQKLTPYSEKTDAMDIRIAGAREHHVR